MRLIRITAPTEHPVTEEEFKLQIRTDSNFDMQIMQQYLDAAVEFVEERADLAIMTQTLAVRLDDFPLETDTVDLPRAPLQEVLSVAYIDGDGDTQTLADFIYSVSGADGEQPATVRLAYDQDWPDHRGDAEGVIVTYRAGYRGRLLVPPTIKQAVLMLAGHYYSTRGAEAPDQVLRSIDNLIALKRVYS